VSEPIISVDALVGRMAGILADLDVAIADLRAAEVIKPRWWHRRARRARAVAIEIAHGRINAAQLELVTAAQELVGTTTAWFVAFRKASAERQAKQGSNQERRYEALLQLVQEAS
jgi:hypothetical protein